MGMGRSWLVACVLLASSCACGVDPSTPKPNAPADVGPIVAEFERAWGRDVYVPLRIVDTDTIARLTPVAHALGVCTADDNGALILIDETWWARLGPEERWALVMHELGHCVLGRVHNDAEVAGCPESVMVPAVRGAGRCLAAGRRNSREYLAELFDP